MSSPVVLESPRAALEREGELVSWLQSPCVPSPRVQRRRRLGVSRLRCGRGCWTGALSRRHRTQRVLSGRAVEDGARRREPRRNSRARGGYPRDGRPALRRQSDQPLLLLQVGALVGARTRARRAWDHDDHRRHERRRSLRSSTGKESRDGAGNSLAARGARLHESRHSRALAGARNSDVVAAIVALPVVTASVRNAGDGVAAVCGGARRAFAARARRVRQSPRAASRQTSRASRWTWPSSSAGSSRRIRARLGDAVRAAGFASVEIDPRGFRSGSLNVLAGVHTDRGASAPLSGS